MQRQLSLVSGSFYQELLRYGSNQGKTHLSYRPLGKIPQPSHFCEKNSVPVRIWVRSGFSHRHASVWNVNTGSFPKLTSHASPTLLCGRDILFRYLLRTSQSIAERGPRKREMHYGTVSLGATGREGEWSVWSSITSFLWPAWLSPYTRSSQGALHLSESPVFSTRFCH